MSCASILAVKINEKVFSEASSGMSVADLAKKYDVSTTTIRTRIQRGSAICDRTYWKGLSVRLCNCLNAAGFSSDNEVIEKFKVDKQFFLKISNLGPGTFNELSEWVYSKIGLDKTSTAVDIIIRAKIKEIRRLLNEVEKLNDQKEAK
jgi:hypothetical protein